MLKTHVPAYPQGSALFQTAFPNHSSKVFEKLFLFFVHLNRYLAIHPEINNTKGQSPIGLNVVGLAVDAITGGLYNLTPEQISAALSKGHAKITIDKDKFYVAVVLKADPKWKRIGTLKRHI